MEPQIPVTLNLGFAQIQAIVDQMPEDEKERLVACLDRQTGTACFGSSLIPPSGSASS